MARDWLLRNAIEAWVRGEHLMGLRGTVPVVWPSVWVRATDREGAEAALRVMDGPSLVLPDWVCERCHEINGPNFGSCWNCGADGPAEGLETMETETP